MYLRTHGIILSRKNFGEADRILKIYTSEEGKISAIAKGVRRPRSRKAGHLEIGSWCKLFVAKGKNLDIVTEVETKKAFGIDDFSEKKAVQIYHFLELVETLTQDNQKNEEVFKLLLAYLARIEREDNFELVSIVFKIKLLKILGFFSAKNLENSKTKDILEIIEDDQFLAVKQKVKLSDKSYLKLLTFLDSIIENISESKLKTNRAFNSLP